MTMSRKKRSRRSFYVIFCIVFVLARVFDGFIILGNAQQQSVSSVTWGFLVSSLADMYINSNGLVRTTLGIQRGDLYNLYLQGMSKYSERKDHQLLLEKESDATIQFIDDIIMEGHVCDEHIGCLPATVYKYSNGFFSWCSDVRNGRNKVESLWTSSDLDVMLGLYVDLHNPMHVAYKSDEGGVNCKIDPPSSSSLPGPTSLREFWDEGMINEILAPADINKDMNKTDIAVAELHTFLQDHYGTIAREALYTFENIFSAPQYEHMVALWSLATNNATKGCYDFNASSSKDNEDGTAATVEISSWNHKCGNGSSSVEVDDEYVNNAKYALRIQLCVAGVRLAYLLNHAASAALTNDLNQTYSLIWTIILCGTFFCGAILWAIIYPRMKRSFNRRRRSEGGYSPFDDDASSRDMEVDSVFSAE